MIELDSPASGRRGERRRRLPARARVTTRLAQSAYYRKITRSVRSHWRRLSAVRRPRRATVARIRHRHRTMEYPPNPRGNGRPAGPGTRCRQQTVTCQTARSLKFAAHRPETALHGDNPARVALVQRSNTQSGDRSVASVARGVAARGGAPSRTRAHPADEAPLGAPVYA